MVNTAAEPSAVRQGRVDSVDDAYSQRRQAEEVVAVVNDCRRKGIWRPANCCSCGFTGSVV